MEPRDFRLNDHTADSPRAVSAWSRRALLAYYIAIAITLVWVETTRDLSLQVTLLLAVISILAAALPMERYAGRLRMRAVEWQVNNDPLTQLNNRAYFMGELANLLKKRRLFGKRSLAVLILDLDHFKTINDTLGHAAGDQLLKEVGQRLRRLIPEHKVIARLGGDEFGIITEVANKDELLKFGANLVETLNFRTQISSQPIWVNGSAGGAIATVPKPTLVELMSMADIALYQAKAAGRNQMAIHEPHEPLPTVSEISMDYELRLAQERGQLLLFYQPVVDLQTGYINGFEALARWNHPTFGFVSPTKFIPMAEDNGLIQEIGRWVLAEACRQMAEWHLVFGDELTISINLSALQFARPDIAREVEAVLAESGINPRSVHVEITETALGQDEATTLANIKQLRQLGISLAVDDFGVAYSSMNYLRRFPADYLKIDKSFIDEIAEKRTFGVTQALIEVGHTLDMKIIAEGVETAEQLDLIVKAGCDYAQGFLFYKAMRAEDATRLLVDEISERGNSSLTA